jgi:hypothetical protein
MKPRVTSEQFVIIRKERESMEKLGMNRSLR